MSLTGKTALVTGASRGIGRACAESLAAAGARVHIVDLLDCDETLESIESAGGRGQQMHCDVADEASVLEVFKHWFSKTVELDYLVHCAGIIHEKPLLETTMEEFDRVISINLRGSFLVGRESLRNMVQAGHGRIVLIASDLSYYGRETFSPYVASKHGVMGLVRSWAKEFAPHINVNAICPGPIDTPMLATEQMTPEWREKELDIPLKRFGEAHEIAQMATFLCSQGGDYITGQGIGVNGGSVMP